MVLRKSIKPFLSLAAIAAIGGLGAQARASVPVGIPQPAHVVVVMEENANYDQIVGDTTDAPYINNTLLNGALVFTNSHGVEHPSQPNYLDFFAGGNQGINDANGTAANPLNFGPGANYSGDAFPSSTNFNNFTSLPFTGANLGSELAAANVSFTQYAENLPVDSNGNVNISTIDNATTGAAMTNGYARRHDPVVNWVATNPTGNQLPLSADQPFTNINWQGTNFSSLPKVSLIIPNTIDDGHDGSSTAVRVANTDHFLQTQLANYVTWAKTNNSLLIVTWDENDYVEASNQILTVMAGDPSLFQAGTSNQNVNHYNFLRTIEDMYGTGYAGASATASDLAFSNGQFTTVTPEPAALGLFGVGIAGLLLRRRRMV